MLRAWPNKGLQADGGTALVRCSVVLVLDSGGAAPAAEPGAVRPLLPYDIVQFAQELESD